MKKLLIVLLILAVNSLAYSQSYVKSFSKDIALYQAKFYLINEVFGQEKEDYKKFSITPLAASKSSELTAVYYESFSSDKRGLILGFYDDYWTQGSTYKGFGFRNFDYDSAIKLLNKIERINSDEKKFLRQLDNTNTNNISFSFEDMVVIIYKDDNLSGRIRIQWNGFDAEWENTAFRRTKRRFEKAMDN